MGKKVVVRVPATTANLGPGFDTLGMALTLFNTLELEAVDIPGCSVEINGEGEDFLPRGEDNLVVRTITGLFRQLDYHPGGYRLRLENKIPLQRGLGSSAAAIVGGLLAANALAGKPFSRRELLAQAIVLEGHPDNVAAAFLGGVVTVVEDSGNYFYTSFNPPEGLVIYVVVPSFTLATKAARKAIPRLIPLQDAVFNLGRVALLTSALREGRWDILEVALKDRLHQPYRSQLVPGMEDAFTAAREAGAYGAALSGAGPTLIAFGPPGLRIGEAMCQALRRQGVEARAQLLEPGRQGAYILE